MIIIKNLKFFIAFLFFSSLIFSCQTYYRFDIKAGENIPKNAPYTLVKVMDSIDSSLLDTTKIYHEVSYYHNNKEFVNKTLTSLKFNGDGTLHIFRKSNTLDKSNNYIEHRFVIDGDKLQIEGFFPSKGGKTKLYTRELSHGYINGNNVVINWLNVINTVYVKN